MNKTDFYVYLHRSNKTGDIFYVGKGRGARAKDKANRGSAWKVASAEGFTVEYHTISLSETDALSLERKLIETLPNLVNSPPGKPLEFTKEDYSKYFEISEESPSGLIRTSGTWTGTFFKGRIGNCGYLATKNKAKYWRVKFKDKSVWIHRIIWILANGDIPDNFVIDHIDGNSLNNSLSNLRAVPKTINARNTKLKSHNTSGLPNCSIDNGMVRVLIKSDGQIYSKRFTISKYGEEQAFRLACEWRNQKIKELNEQGAGYTERHGT